MATNMKELKGNYCVIVRMDGHSEFMRLENGADVFEKAKSFIGCKWLDHVQIQSIAPSIELEFLVNDEGYPQWGNDPSKINHIGTYIYNRGQKPGHYILGDIVICLSVDGDDGGEFVGMCEGLAANITLANNRDIINIARKICGNPETIPYPSVTVSSYASTDDMIKAMQGDTSIEPIAKQTLGGDEDGKAEA